jgi:exodeoxyribonuclease VII large subunit
VEKLARAFRDPRLLLASMQQRLDDRVATMARVVTRRFARERDVHAKLVARLGATHPRAHIARDRARLTQLTSRLSTKIRALLADDRGALGALASRLDAMSPLAVLGRGYAIATKGGRAVRDATDVTRGDRVRVRVARGSFDADVTGTGEDDA